MLGYHDRYASEASLYRLTARRKQRAADILDHHTKVLHDTRYINVSRLEHALRERWNIGYQSLKGIMIDMANNHPEYSHLAAYYMEHSNPTGVVSEFQQPLADLFGLTSWDFDDSKEGKRKEYWDNAFALITNFDLNIETNGQSFLQISRLLNDQLVSYFLQNPKHLRSMDSRNFEELIAELLSSFGYTVELTQATRDNGRDIIALGNEKIAKTKYLIECKRYAESNKVGIQPVRSLHGVVNDERATKGIIVTTSSFTKPATEFLERNKWTLEGRAFDGVLDWLREYQNLNFPSGN